MKVVVDTCVWSFALRRRSGHLNAEQRQITAELAELIREGRVILPGPVRQELLSGVRDEKTFDRLREHLRSFEDELLTADDHEEAARCRNRCQAVGVAGSPTDFLLCAVAMRRGAALFTTDTDFERYAQHLPLRLHIPRRR